MKISPLIINNSTTTCSTSAKNSALNTASSVKPYTDSIYTKSKVGLVCCKNNINFGYNFVLKKHMGIPCAYCGKEMFSKEDSLLLVKSKGTHLVNYIKKYVSQNPKLLDDAKLAAIKELEQIALTFCNKNARELLPIVYAKARMNMIYKQQNIYSNISLMAKLIKCQELVDYLNKLQFQDVIINPQISSDDLTTFLTNNNKIQYRKQVVWNIMSYAMKYYDSNPPAWRYILEQLNNLPSSKNDPDAYLVKFISKSMRKDPKIANEYVSLNENEAILFYYNLLQPFISSAEHIRPHSKDGCSSLSNYLVTHAWCNNVRKSTDFHAFVKSNPKVLENILNNLRYIALGVGDYSACRNFSKSGYVSKIKERLQSELQDYIDEPAIANFLHELRSINLISQSKLYTITDKSCLNSVKQLFKPILYHSNSKERNARLNKLNNDLLIEITRSRRIKINKIIGHLDEYKNKNLREFLITLMRDGLPDQFYSKDYDELNYSISDNFLTNYNNYLESELKRVSSLDAKVLDDKEIKAMVKRIGIKKTPELAAFKVLANSRFSNGDFDTIKIMDYLDAGQIE